MLECDGVELYLLNESFEKIAVIDKYKSFIWTERYNDLGDCEIELSDHSLKDIFKKDYYLSKAGSDQLMIIDEFQGDTSLDEGKSLRVSGHSSEKVLDRRVIWERITYSGPLQGFVRTIMNQNVIDPLMDGRRIPGFGFAYNSDMEKSYSISVVDLIGDNVYDTIKSSCDLYDVGFRNRFNGYDGFSLQLYNGTDRSSVQSANNIVTLSPKIENLKNISFVDSNADFKNVVYVVADNTEYLENLMPDQDAEMAYLTASVGNVSGIDRRETYLSVDLSENRYANKQIFLNQQGRLALKEYSDKVLYSGEYQETDTFKINEDFFLGDIVQMVDDYGNESRVRVSEVIYSEDDTGYTVYPTLTSI